MNNSQTTTINVDEPSDGTRLDALVARTLGLSRAEARRIIDEGKVAVDRRTVDTKHRAMKVTMGRQITIQPYNRSEELQVIAEPHARLSIVHESTDWVIVNKTAGVPVHPLKVDETGTALNAAIARYPRIQNIGDGGLRSGVVHRLDVDTSGALLFALNDDAWQQLRNAWGGPSIQKTYHAIVHGRLRGGGREEMTLIIASHKPARVDVLEVHDSAMKRKGWASATSVKSDRDDRPFSTDAGPRHPKDARRCYLTWQTLHERDDDTTLIEIDLGTGFLHQIRAMFAHVGHPVVGDAVYGSREGDKALGAPRLMLHAQALSIEGNRYVCPPPATFAVRQ